MNLKLIKSETLGACQIVRIGRFGWLTNLLRWVKNCLISSFPIRLVIWAGHYSYNPKNKSYMPYGVYNERVQFLDTFWYQQRTRASNVKNMASVGCSQ